MAAETEQEQARIIRAVRQRLEALGRAGLDRIPRPAVLPEPVTRPVASRAVAAEAQSPEVVVTESTPPRPRPATRSPAPAPTAGPALPVSMFDGSGFESPPLSPEERSEALRALAEQVAACTLCPLLASTRTQTVFGEGNPNARLMFIGEAPGATEDRTGRPFVGPAGQLLTDMITKGMGLKREDVYIANILKSRPPGNRDPQPDEIRNCLPFLERQIEIIRPEFLCLLGKPASSTLLATALPMGRIRGRWHRYRGIPTIATWHPSYLLRTPTAKKDTWADLQMLMRAMGLKVPEPRKG